MAALMVVDYYQIFGEIYCFHLQFRNAPSKTDDGGRNFIESFVNSVQEESMSYNLEHHKVKVFSGKGKR
jgi:hypothetical protein